MRKLNELRSKKLMYMAFGIIALIFTIMCTVSVEKAVSGTAICAAFVIGGVSYEDDNAGIAKALGDIAVKFDEKIKAAGTKDDIEKIKADYIKDVNDLKDRPTREDLKAAVDDINTKLKAQWEEVVKKLSEQSTQTEKPKTFREILKHAIESSDAVEKATDEDGNEVYKFKRLKSGKDEFFIEKAVDMNTANSVRPGATPGVAIGYLTDYGMTPQELALSIDQHFLTAGFPVQNITDKYFGVVIEETESDGAAVKAETAVAGDSSFLWKTLEFKVFDFASKFRVHQNTLDDMNNVMMRIQTLGIDRLLQKIDYYTLGSAGDNTATPYGLKNTGYFTAYDTALRAHEVTAANIVNVIKNAVLQATLVNRNVNAVIMHPSDIAEIEDLKDLNANTVNLSGLRLDATGKLAYIYGLRVIRNSKMTTNTAIVCDLTESVQYGQRSALGVRIGYDQTTDFSKNIVTIQLEGRFAIGLGTPASIIYISDIAAAQTELTVL